MDFSFVSATIAHTRPTQMAELRRPSTLLATPESGRWRGARRRQRETKAVYVGDGVDRGCRRLTRRDFEFRRAACHSRPVVTRTPADPISRLSPHARTK